MCVPHITTGNFLNFRADSAIKILEINEGKRCKELFLDDNWAIFKFSSRGGSYFFAEHLSGTDEATCFAELRSKLEDKATSEYAFLGPLRGY